MLHFAELHSVNCPSPMLMDSFQGAKAKRRGLFLSLGMAPGRGRGSLHCKWHSCAKISTSEDITERNMF